MSKNGHQPTDPSGREGRMLTKDGLQGLIDQALGMAYRERTDTRHANADQRARLYERLADAAYGVSNLLTADTYYTMWGEPPAPSESEPEDGRGF